MQFTSTCINSSSTAKSHVETILFASLCSIELLIVLRFETIAVVKWFMEIYKRRVNPLTKNYKNGHERNRSSFSLSIFEFLVS